MNSTTVIGAVNFACGKRVSYDDTNPEHKANRLHRTTNRPWITCPVHGPEKAWCAVSGPAHLLWPDPAERAEVMREIAMDRADDDRSFSDSSPTAAPCQPFTRVA